MTPEIYKYIYELDFKVRDYECDIQGIVNNAVYQNYLEHTRHEFLHSLNEDFAAMHQNGVDPVVVKSELEYKYPLHSGDIFVCRLALQRDGFVKFKFIEDVYVKLDDGTEKLCLKGVITCAVTINGRPVKVNALPEGILKLLNSGKEE